MKGRWEAIVRLGKSDSTNCIIDSKRTAREAALAHDLAVLRLETGGQLNFPELSALIESIRSGFISSTVTPLKALSAGQ